VRLLSPKTCFGQCSRIVRERKPRGRCRLQLQALEKASVGRDEKRLDAALACDVNVLVPTITIMTVASENGRMTEAGLACVPPLRCSNSNSVFFGICYSAGVSADQRGWREAAALGGAAIAWPHAQQAGLPTSPNAWVARRETSISRPTALFAVPSHRSRRAIAASQTPSRVTSKTRSASAAAVAQSLRASSPSS